MNEDSEGVYRRKSHESVCLLDSYTGVLLRTTLANDNFVCIYLLIIMPPPTKEQLGELMLRFKSQSDLYSFMSIVCKSLSFLSVSGAASANKVLVQTGVPPINNRGEKADVGKL